MQEQLRDNPLMELQQPVQFIHGTCDNLCEERQFKAVLKRMVSSRKEVRTALPSSMSMAQVSVYSFWHLEVPDICTCVPILAPSEPEF